MIVTTGKHVRVNSNEARVELERTAETPGCITIRDREGGSIKVLCNPVAAADFIHAFRYAASADVPYRETDVNPEPEVSP